MGDTFAVMRTLERSSPASAVIVGAGYVGLEMADALIARGLAVTQIEQLSEVLATVDAQLGALVHAELEAQGVEVLTGTTARRISANPSMAGCEWRRRQRSARASTDGRHCPRRYRRPPRYRARSSGRGKTWLRGAIQVDRAMQTHLPDVLAAGDCVVTHHRLLGETYLPLGTTAHKQGRVAGENALGG